MSAFLDSDLGDKGQTIDQSSLFRDGIGERSEKRACGLPCTLLNVGAKTKHVHSLSFG